MCLATVRAVQAAYSGISCEQPTASSSSGLSCSKVSVIDCVSGVGGDSCVCVCVPRHKQLVVLGTCLMGL